MELTLSSNKPAGTGAIEGGVVDAVLGAPEPDPAGKSPLRRCIATREILDKSAMIRFVLDPADQVVPDLRQRLPGRGLWVKAEPAALAQAIKTNAFAKAARQSARIPADLPARIAALLRQDVVHLLGLARKSGDLTTGFEKVERELRAGRVMLLIAASDAAADGRTKLARLAGSDVEISAPLSAAELAAALGRETAVHAALKPSGIAERLLLACHRLAAFTAADVPGPGKRN
ncbi:MAG TPA: RNA-binding protein [Dongiaceae bacterium]|nr:RNA-binding protein [Dongiaceae bacterium]